MNHEHEHQEPTLDRLVETIRDVVSSRYPDCIWASIVIERPNMPKTVLTVTPRDLPYEPPLESAVSLPLVL